MEAAYSFDPAIAAADERVCSWVVLVVGDDALEEQRFYSGVAIKGWDVLGIGVAVGGRALALLPMGLARRHECAVDSWLGTVAEWPGP